jgi:hypothetical protein
MELSDRYDKVINIMCEYKKISRNDLFKILKDRNCKYILFLLLKKYNCTDLNTLNIYFPECTQNTLTYGIKKAKEKLLINRCFREQYFELEDIIDKYK